MHIYDLAETWFSEYQTIDKKSNHFPFKLEGERAGIKKRGIKEYAYLWGQKNKKSVKQVCEKFCIQTEQMYDWIKYHRLVSLPSGRKSSSGKIQVQRTRGEIKVLCEAAYDKMKNHGMSQTQACRAFKVSNITIQRYIKNLK